MIKTWEEYYNDPEILNEPQALREIHAARLKIYDETKDMTPEEYTAYVHAGAMRFMNGTPQKTTG